MVHGLPFDRGAAAVVTLGVAAAHERHPQGTGGVALTAVVVRRAAHHARLWRDRPRRGRSRASSAIVSRRVPSPSTSPRCGWRGPSRQGPLPTTTPPPPGRISAGGGYSEAPNRGLTLIDPSDGYNATASVRHGGAVSRCRHATTTLTGLPMPVLMAFETLKAGSRGRASSWHAGPRTGFRSRPYR